MAQARTLAARMTELDPAVAAGRLGGFRPRAKEGQRAIVFQDHIAGALQVAPVDHYVAGQEQAGAALDQVLYRVLCAWVGRPCASAKPSVIALLPSRLGSVWPQGRWSGCARELFMFACVSGLHSAQADAADQVALSQ